MPQIKDTDGEWLQKQGPCMCCSLETQFRPKDTDWKWCHEKRYLKQVEINKKKKTGVAILI